MSAKSGRPLIVLFASILAYMVVTTISVFIGATLGKYIKPEFIRYFGAMSFIMIGVLMLLGKYTSPNPTGGMLIYVSKNDVIDINIKIEDALKFIVSAGMVPLK